MATRSKIGAVTVQGAIPLRLSLLLTKEEVRNLALRIDALNPGVVKEVEALEWMVRDTHRIASGAHSEGTFEFRHYGDGADEDPDCIDVLAFCLSEFPALMSEWGGILPEGEEPAEFVMTGRFTAMLLRSTGANGKWSRLVVRRGAVEVGFTVPRKRHSSVSDAILDVEGYGAAARGWLAPVATEIAECNLLTKA